MFHYSSIALSYVILGHYQLEHGSDARIGGHPLIFFLFLSGHSARMQYAYTTDAKAGHQHQHMQFARIIILRHATTFTRFKLGSHLPNHPISQAASVPSQS